MKTLQGTFGLFVTLSLLLSPLHAGAAALYIDPATSSLFRGDAINLSVRLDVDEEARECVNVVDATIAYPPNIDPVDVSVGKSILKFWVEEPTINREERTITFAGGIPNGYCGRVQGDPMLTNTLVELIFRSPGFVIGASQVEDSSRAVIALSEESTLYLNDGKGTQVTPALYPATINLEQSVGRDGIQDPWNDAVDADTIRPEEFSIQLYQQDKSGKWIITYSTTDKQTGIDRYEIMEDPIENLGNFQWGRADAPWMAPKHPNTYELRDQTLNSVIRVKAVDKAGNERIATLIPDESIRTAPAGQTANYAIAAAGLVLLIAIAVVVVVVLRQRRAIRSNDEELEEDEFEDDEDASEEEDSAEVDEDNQEKQ